MLDLFLVVHAAHSSLVVSGGGDGTAAASSTSSALRALAPFTMPLLHNDCRLLGHMCLSLGSEYAASLPTDALRSAATFVDRASALQRIAAQHLCAAVDAQRAQLMLILGLARDFASDDPVVGSWLGVGDDGGAHDAAEQALRQLARALRGLRSTWGR